MEFHKVSDMIVVGAGTAGFPAAIRAKELDPKLEVLLLEARPNYASSLFMKPSFGLGLPDEEWYKEGVKSGGEPELWRAYADRGRWLYDWLKGIGVRPPDDETWKEMRKMQSIPGPGTIKIFDKVAKEKKVEVLFNHRASRLITDPETRRVLGLKFKKKGKS